MYAQVLCKGVSMHAVACRGQKRVVDPLELEFQAVVAA